MTLTVYVLHRDVNWVSPQLGLTNYLILGNSLSEVVPDLTLK